MSLFSLLGSSPTASSAYGSNTTPLAVQKALAAAQGQTSTSLSGSAGSSGSEVTISAAAAAKADNAKDFTTLTNEVRATLDTQYKAAADKGTANPRPDLSAMTGRALAAITLNKSGSFSRAEQFAAKSALDQQTRQEFVAAMANGTSVATIGSYGAAIVNEYDAMSPEEREARGWSENFRNVAQTSASASTSSLFDMIGDD